MSVSRNITGTMSAIAIAAALTASLAAPTRAEVQVPNLDVTPTCRPLAKNDMQLDEERCRQSENDARDQLKRQWSSYPAAERAQCITTATMGGTASYVELITCLEMAKDARALPKSAKE